MMLIMAIDHTWDGGDDDDDTGDGGGGSNYLLPSLPCHSALPLWEHVRLSWAEDNDDNDDDVDIDDND